MFPDAQYAPSFCAKLSIHPAITSHVAVELRFPEVEVAFWAILMLRAAMPEAAVNEHRKLDLREGEVWSPNHGVMSSPANDTMCPKDLCKDCLSGFIAFAANARHDLRALALREYIRHLCLALHELDQVNSLTANEFWR